MESSSPAPRPGQDRITECGWGRKVLRQALVAELTCIYTRWQEANANKKPRGYSFFHFCAKTFS
jgi:hypothetical protein